MALDLSDLLFQGPALPEPFVKFELEKELTKLNLLPKNTGKEGEELAAHWEIYRRKLRAISTIGGSIHVQNHVIDPLLQHLGYDRIDSADAVKTTEEPKVGESGGVLLVNDDGSSKLRVWCASFDEDLFAPVKRGRAYRYSHLRIAQRVLKATGERLGLLTNGVEAILLISEPARIDSTITFSIDPNWKRSRSVPDSYRFFLAMCSPNGVAALPDLIDKARLQQARVTKELRVQARQAVERFIQEVLDHPANREWYEKQTDKTKLAKELWHEGLVTIYRLLFILKLEASDDPARVFSFASNSLWRNTFSPSMALAPFSQEVLYSGVETGSLLESGLKTVFRMFESGCASTELNIKPLGGALFGENATPHLSALAWGEQAAAHILDRLLWTPRKRGSETRERVHYGSLDVEDLGRVYEALLELDAGITTEPMCRLRRQKLEVVVPIAQGEKYRPKSPVVEGELSDGDDSDDDETEEEEAPKGKKTKVEWIEEIPPERFFLRVGLGRKATGSYYTPHSFVKFLVQETINPLLAEHSPADDPKPIEMLRLKIVDIAMGSGHFLAEACRYLGSKLYEACRYCDEKALEAERKAEESKKKEDRSRFTEEAREWRQRIIDLPDPDDEILMYLPSRSTEGEESGLSQKRAEALCRRLVATHCLYGVDKNPLAVELAKLVLWIEAHAEGMPLTFLDHRLVVGDSLTGAFWKHLTWRPSNPKEPIEHLFANDLDRKLSQALRDAIRSVGELDASVGTSVADMENKKRIKAEIDRALLPFRVVAAAWSGGVMLGREYCDDEGYEQLLLSIAKTGDLPEVVTSPKLLAMIAQGLGISEIQQGAEKEVPRGRMLDLVGGSNSIPAISLDLAFPEVFYPNGEPFGRRGFHAVLGNPPWDRIRPFKKEFLASYDFTIIDANESDEVKQLERLIFANTEIKSAYDKYNWEFESLGRVHDALFEWHEVSIGNIKAGRGNSDSYILFMERNIQIASYGSYAGVVVPSAFHSNEGATGIRKLYFEYNRTIKCYSFENSRKIFDIHRSFKFVTLVAQKGLPTEKVQCAFYLHDEEWLFLKNETVLEYTLEFVRKTGGQYLSLLEIKKPSVVGVVNQCYSNTIPFGRLVTESNIEFSVQADMTRDKYRFTSTNAVLPPNVDPRHPSVSSELLEAGYVPLFEGKSFWHYDNIWGNRPKYLIALRNIADKHDWLDGMRYYRMAYRAIQNAENERTLTIVLLCPGSICGNSAPSERTPSTGKNVDRLVLLSICSSYPPDWILRLKTTANVNKFILDSLRLPKITEEARSFLAHSALRLICTHSGYSSLWKEQLGSIWREEASSSQFPVVGTENQKWEIRSCVDAVIAELYGIRKDQYESILSAFSHGSYPKAPELCLAKFDELKSIGLEAFTKTYDPYWDVPLNEELPKPVIEIAGLPKQTTVHELVMSYEPPKRGKSKRRK